jgi:outer membrane protein assembly factor BamB
MRAQLECTSKRPTSLEVTVLPWFARIVRRPAVMLASLACATAACAHAGEPPWPQVGHDGRQSNVNDGEDKLTPANVASLRVMHAKDGAAAPGHLPAIGRNHAFESDARHGLASISTKTGKLRWLDDERTTLCSPVLSDDGAILAFTNLSLHNPAGRGALTAVDTATGAVLWEQVLKDDAGAKWSGCPSIGGNFIVVVEDLGHLDFSKIRTYDIRDGSPQPHGGLDSCCWIHPRTDVQGDWFYFVLHDLLEKRGIRDSSGEWVATLGLQTKGRPGAPRLGGDMVLVSDSEGGVYAFDAASGASRWTLVLPTAPGTTPGVSALTDATAFAVSHPPGSQADAIQALRVRDGKGLWSAPLAGTALVHSNLVLANGMIFAGTGADGSCTTLTVMDAGTGASIAQVATGMPAGGADPCDLAVANGQVILHRQGADGPALRLLALPS